MTKKQALKIVDARINEINGGESSPQGYDELIEAAYLEDLHTMLQDELETKRPLESIQENAASCLRDSMHEVCDEVGRALGLPSYV